MAIDSSQSPSEKEFKNIAEKVEAAGAQSAQSGDVSNVLSNKVVESIDNYIDVSDKLISQNKLSALLMEKSPRELIKINNGLHSASKALPSETKDDPSLAVLASLASPRVPVPPPRRRRIDSERAAADYRRGRGDRGQAYRDQRDLDEIMKYNRPENKHEQDNALAQTLELYDEQFSFKQKLDGWRREAALQSSSLSIGNDVLGAGVKRVFDKGAAFNLILPAVLICIVFKVVHGASKSYRDGG